MNPEHSTQALRDFTKIISKRHVLTKHRETKPYRTGYRSGTGQCFAVLRPGTLLEMWQILQKCIQYDLIVIVQAANTGLTAGSSPTNGYDRDVIIISTRRISKIFYLNSFAQAICLPGATLNALEKKLNTFEREPHSVIGSSCIGASVIGGICNNSGGSLIARGPAYTELSIFAKVNIDGELVLINNLGIDLGKYPEEILTRLEHGQFSQKDVHRGDGVASDKEYKNWVRDVTAPSPARFNADPRRLMDTSGCAGKVAVFGVRLDTFPRTPNTYTFHIGSNSTQALSNIRRVFLTRLETLPISAEYMHRNTFMLTEKYGRDTVHLIKILGTTKLNAFLTLKSRINDQLASIPILPANFVDHCLQFIGRMSSNPLSKRSISIGRNFEHQLILKAGKEIHADVIMYLDKWQEESQIDYYACTEAESKSVALHRFAAAGAAIRYSQIKGREAGELLSLDIALKRDEKDWFEKLPLDISKDIDISIYYGHFFCHVFHQDYILKPTADAKNVKAKMLNLIDQRGAKYPAEHNVGQIYVAEPHLAKHYQELDPANIFNPGIGCQSKSKYYSNTNKRSNVRLHTK